MLLLQYDSYNKELSEMIVVCIQASIAPTLRKQEGPGMRDQNVLGRKPYLQVHG